ncbi:penicillin acylase family protein [Phenylobacterium sp.]|uniref:penicillin acylase family protein n=1 Tax=Phenylobacterium sp. TaxID=1871053 RepID=UPI0035AF29BD
MRRAPSLLLALALAAGLALPAQAEPQDLARLQRQAAKVRIVRDDWGIAHVRGRTDADAVFGMIYAQAEDDFPRIEANYLASLGRAAEAEGEAAIWRDLRQRLFVDHDDLRRRYEGAPASLKRLMQAWADGLNYYLATHPKVRPQVIARFEPWMALSFSEGSIGGDISKVSLEGLAAFYGETRTAGLDPAAQERFPEPTGSNGIAIAPSRTADGRALLLINPHTSFYFRSELQMTSDEGLDAYGAVTWGQFFIYQGFNANAGWMHTTSSMDAVDEFAETIVERDGRPFYRYGAEARPVAVSQIVIPYRTADGGRASRNFTVYRTHHGPIVRAEGGKWIATALMHRPVEALRQSFERTKVRDLAGFMKVSELAANSSNNTLFADSRGNVAFLMPQFLPRRDGRFDYTRPVDGSDPATDWQGVHAPDTTPNVANPPNGWVYNANDGPWWAAGAGRFERTAFPAYFDQVGQNARTPHALKVLQDRTDFTVQGLIDAAYDPWLPAFERLLPGLAAAYDALPAGDPRRAALAEPVAALRQWDRRWSAQSVETSLAVFWGEALWDAVAPAAKAAGQSNLDYMAEHATAEQRLAALDAAVARLRQDFGDWRTPWGEINRFQRLTGDITPKFDDAAPSLPTPFTSAQWGSLASFGARRYEGTRRYYGSSGNSFVAVVEFGPRVRARAISAGGESGDPLSPHFNDQALRYTRGDLRPVYFYPDELRGHVARTYRPGG